MLTQLEDLWNYAQSISNDDKPNPELHSSWKSVKKLIKKQ